VIRIAVSHFRIDRTQSCGYASAPTSDWTYIQNTATDERELYNRTDDPDHEHDRYESGEVSPDVGERLEAVVERHVSRLGGRTAPQSPLGDGIARRLDALGYQ